MRIERVTFNEAFERLIGHEGKFTDNPKDRGNWTGGRPGIGELKGTKYGIAASTYPDLDIKNLTLEDAKAIYYRDWWLKCGANEIDSAIIYQMWQFAVNAGMGNGKRCLQRAVKVLDDGDLGPKSLAAVKAMDLNDVLFRFFAATIRHYTSCSKELYEEFGKGWMNRVAANLDYAAEDN
jgi:lysozyme family protein